WQTDAGTDNPPPDTAREQDGMTTIFLARPHPQNGPAHIARVDADIDTDGTAHYGPSADYRILAAPAGSYGMTAEEAQAIFDHTHQRPQPLYAITTLPDAAPTPETSVAVSTGQPAPKRWEHSVTIEDRRTCAHIAADTCHMLIRPLGEFSRKGGTCRGNSYTGVAGARPGDLIWVKEPFTLYRPRRHGGEGFIATAADEAATAAGMRRTNAGWQSFDWNTDYHQATRQAATMARYQSRMTLVVTRIRTGRNSVALSQLTDADAHQAGFRGDAAADQLLAHLRTTTDERAFGVNPYMVLVEFVAYRANIDDMTRWLKPMPQHAEPGSARTSGEAAANTWNTATQIRRKLPHEISALQTLAAGEPTR
ncbi:MAG: hypothetical protein WCD42_09365, partial [Rhizomicrobium sp.]